MMIFGNVIMCLLALIVLLGGLFLLGYAKKEGWGKFTKLASYVSIAFSTIVFVIGLIGFMACPSKCGSGHCKMEKRVECHKMIKKDCKGETCTTTEMKECHGNSCEDKSECDSSGKNCEKCTTECKEKCKKENCDEACMKACESK